MNERKYKTYLQFFHQLTFTHWRSFLSHNVLSFLLFFFTAILLFFR